MQTTLPQKIFPEELARPAPRGFTIEQWKLFERDGFLAIEDAIEPGAVQILLDAVRQVSQTSPSYDPARTWKITRMLEKHPAFVDLIDHDRHVGYAYDLYGEQLRLIQGDAFIRPRQGVINHWHVDGPRAVPYNVVSPIIPLKLRIGYWLTDVWRSEMGNFIYVPGSHRADRTEEYAGLEQVDGQVTLLCKAGTMTIAHSNLWHRVDRNASDTTRINMFLSYAPSWIAGYHIFDDEFVAGLARSQRIILRNYREQKLFSRPPAEDIPLFDDPALMVETRGNEPQKVRRRTRYERILSKRPAND